MKKTTIVIIIISTLLGICTSVLTEILQIPAWLKIVMLNIGSGLIATAIISLILDLFWSKERIEIEKQELRPFLNEFKEFTDKLDKLEGRLEAFKLQGLSCCFPNRDAALDKFFNYAVDIIKNKEKNKNRQDFWHNKIIIVTRSAKGLLGYIDREDSIIQQRWREIITNYPKYFNILLTHPKFAYLRNPAEENSSGSSETDILKSAIYLLMVANMEEDTLRLYRGTSTAFLMQINKHYLVNIYPYGCNASNIFCLEFENENSDSYIARFAQFHFSHTWHFMYQPSKRVDDKPIIEGISNFSHILNAFSECTTLINNKDLRFTKYQVEGLDYFFKNMKKLTKQSKLEELHIAEEENPFMKFVIENEYTCCNEVIKTN